MAQGDWGPGVQLRLLNFYLAVDPSSGTLLHAGVGYEIVSADGRVLKADGGYTWHSPHPELPSAPSEHVQALETVLRAWVSDLLDHEGIADLAAPSSPRAFRWPPTADALPA
jgi:hypothetical protein